jgi:hypothetical protein
MNLLNLARMYSSTLGTGSPLTLTSAVPTYLTFAQAGAIDGKPYGYAIYDPPHRESGWGTMGASGTTLTRNVGKSTNGNNAIVLSGQQQVFITPRAEDIMSGSIYPPFKAPVDSDFTWINQGGASIAANANGGIYLLGPANAGDSLRIRKKAAPATPYTITAALLVNLIAVDFQQCGLIFRQSSDGKLISYNYVSGNTLGDFEFQSVDYTNATTFSAVNTQADYVLSGPVWLRITDDGTTRTGSWSIDGYNFTPHYSEGRTIFLTADEVGFFVNTSNATSPVSGTLLSWEEN